MTPDTVRCDGKHGGSHMNLSRIQQKNLEAEMDDSLAVHLKIFPSETLQTCCMIFTMYWLIGCFSPS